jgi:hypothetical protein
LGIAANHAVTMGKKNGAPKSKVGKKSAADRKRAAEHDKYWDRVLDAEIKRSVEFHAEAPRSKTSSQDIAEQR